LRQPGQQIEEMVQRWTMELSPQVQSIEAILAE
jgi:hypothetical protein